MPGGEKLMSLGVEDLGVLGVFGVPGAVDLGVPGKFPFGLLVKVVFLVSGVSMFTIFCPYSLRPKP